MRIRSFMHSSSRWWILMLALGLFGTASAATAPNGQNTQSTANTARYVDMMDYLPTWQEQDAWFDTIYQLKRNFNDTCPDTYCSGEYTNIEALRYRCSVETATGLIGQCIWVLAASNERVDPETGHVIVDSRQWQCPSPLAPDTSAQELMNALKGSEPMHQLLPRTHRTIHEGLIDCLL